MHCGREADAFSLCLAARRRVGIRVSGSQPLQASTSAPRSRGLASPRWTSATRPRRRRSGTSCARGSPRTSRRSSVALRLRRCTTDDLAPDARVERALSTPQATRGSRGRRSTAARARRSPTRRSCSRSSARAEAPRARRRDRARHGRADDHRPRDRGAEGPVPARRSSPARRSGARGSPSPAPDPISRASARAAGSTTSRFVLDGQKVWSSYAHVADFCILLARSDPDSQRARRADLRDRRHARTRGRGAPAATDHR